MDARLTIISLAELHRDGRVQRQIEYLSRTFDVTVIAYGDMPSNLAGKAKMLSATRPSGRGILRKIQFLYGLVAGRFLYRAAYNQWYWSRTDHQQVYQHLLDSQPDLIHANDWHTLPLAARVADETGAKLLSDLHEYFPLQYENRRSWRMWRHPMFDYFLRRYSGSVAQFVTVGELIAKRYQKEYGFEVDVIRNAPQAAENRPLKPTDSETIHLVHHGASMADRKLELMIETVHYLDERYVLHLILVDSEPDYTAKLKQLAAAVPNERIKFHEPVEPSQIADRIAAYDIGIFILPFTSFSYQAALPNKFFEFIAAGLAICIGPSPEMATLTQQYQIGLIAPTFDPQDVAQMLNQLTTAEIDQMKANTQAARKDLNAEVEMEKLITLHTSMLPNSFPADSCNELSRASVKSVHPTSATADSKNGHTFLLDEPKTGAIDYP